MVTRKEAIDSSLCVRKAILYRCMVKKINMLPTFYSSTYNMSVTVGSLIQIKELPWLVATLKKYIC